MIGQSARFLVKCTTKVTLGARLQPDEKTVSGANLIQLISLIRKIREEAVSSRPTSRSERLKDLFPFPSISGHSARRTWPVAQRGPSDMAHTLLFGSMLAGYNPLRLSKPRPLIS